jgi:hypothetical protein
MRHRSFEVDYVDPLSGRRFLAVCGSNSAHPAQSGRVLSWVRSNE